MSERGARPLQRRCGNCERMTAGRFAAPQSILFSHAKTGSCRCHVCRLALCLRHGTSDRMGRRPMVSEPQWLLSEPPRKAHAPRGVGECSRAGLATRGHPSPRRRPRQQQHRKPRRAQPRGAPSYTRAPWFSQVDTRTTGRVDARSVDTAPRDGAQVRALRQRIRIDRNRRQVVRPEVSTRRSIRSASEASQGTRSSPARTPPMRFVWHRVQGPRPAYRHMFASVRRRLQVLASRASRGFLSDSRSSTSKSKTRTNTSPTVS